MAISSIGYDGLVDEIGWAALAGYLGSEPVVGPGPSLVVSPVDGVDRTVRVNGGVGYAHGVLVTSTAPVDLQLPVLGAGVRWDAIVLRREWAPTGGTSTFMVVQGSPVAGDPALLQRNPGVIADQVLALVRVTAGQQVPTGVVDRRHKRTTIIVRDPYDSALTVVGAPDQSASLMELKTAGGAIVANTRSDGTVLGVRFSTIAGTMRVEANGDIVTNGSLQAGQGRFASLILAGGNAVVQTDGAISTNTSLIANVVAVNTARVADQVVAARAVFLRVGAQSPADVQIQGFGDGTISIAQTGDESTIGTHPNGIVLFVRGATLMARKPDGTSVAIG